MLLFFKVQSKESYEEKLEETEYSRQLVLVVVRLWRSLSTAR
jgi:hypothetical protein